MLEDSLKQLAALVEKLENKNNTLEDALALFERGVKLTRECLDAVNVSRGKIVELSKEMDKIIERPIDE
ncbi:exodeoxyribonuclease 7 small subunit [Clostridia bacterium]|nr:exodeoxyribonuclease 7 small subunit [Clostridia bacterium]